MGSPLPSPGSVAFYCPPLPLPVPFPKPPAAFLKALSIQELQQWQVGERSILDL